MMNSYAGHVWVVFFISDETLEWELAGLFASEQSARIYMAMQAEEDPYIEYKAEHWAVHQ